jgi:hypothetical protein
MFHFHHSGLNILILYRLFGYRLFGYRLFRLFGYRLFGYRLFSYRLFGLHFRFPVNCVCESLLKFFFHHMLLILFVRYRRQ